jgi:hypothetical protein
MTFREFRDKAAWVALTSAILVVVGQWWTHTHYVDRTVWVDRTPPVLDFLGLCLSLLTLILGLLTFPRWQSFLALAGLAWVIFIFMQGL